MMCIRTATTSKYPKNDKVKSEGGKLSGKPPLWTRSTKGALALHFCPCDFSLCAVSREMAAA